MAEPNKTPDANSTNQNTTNVTPAAPAANAPDASVIPAGAAPDVSKSPDANASGGAPDTTPTTPEEPKATGKFAISYIGNGIWTDQTGQMWCKEEHRNYISTKTFTKKELADRPDIEWMVDYGSMRKTAV